MKRVFVLALAPAVLFAERAHPFLDLSGPWTKIQSGAPGIEVRLPLARTPQTSGRYRLERRFQLDQPAAGMALLLAPLLGTYTLSVNGREIGRFGRMGSSFAPPPVYREYPIPDGVFKAG